MKICCAGTVTFLRRKSATLLGKQSDSAAFAVEASATREAFNRLLFQADTQQYDRGSQTANVIPLALGMVPAASRRAVLEHLVEDIRAHNNHVTAGDIGFHYVVRALKHKRCQDPPS